MILRPPRSTPLYSSAASDVYKRQVDDRAAGDVEGGGGHAARVIRGGEGGHMADIGERRRPVEHGPAFDVSGDGLPAGETLRQRLGHPAGLQGDDPDPERS